MLTTNPGHVFAARCPQGHRPPQTRTLRELRDPSVQFYCELCQRAWNPPTVERIRALEFAEASESAEAPPSAA
jgi:hypothetical protein